MLDPRFSLIDELVKEINKNNTDGRYLSKNHIRDCRVEEITPQKTYSTNLTIDEINNLVKGNDSKSYHNKKAILTTHFDQTITVTYHAMDINLIYTKKIGGGWPPSISGLLSDEKLFNYLEDNFGIMGQHLEIHRPDGVGTYEMKRTVRAKRVSPYRGEIVLSHYNGFYYSPSHLKEAIMSSAYINQDSSYPVSRFSLHYYDNAHQVTMERIGYEYNKYFAFYTQYGESLSEFERAIGANYYYKPRGLNHRSYYICLPKEFPYSQLNLGNQRLLGEIQVFHNQFNRCYNFSGNNTTSFTTEDRKQALDNSFANVLVIPNGIYNINRGDYDGVNVRVLVIQNSLGTVDAFRRDELLKTLKKIYINTSWSAKNLYQVMWPSLPAPANDNAAIAQFEKKGVEVISIPMGV